MLTCRAEMLQSAAGRKAWFLVPGPVFLMMFGAKLARRLPSLNALKAFEAAARHESFTKAAEELSVTQGAISHQVKALELELGIRLFDREWQKLNITRAGLSYLEVLRDAFDRIAL